MKRISFLFLASIFFTHVSAQTILKKDTHGLYPGEKTNKMVLTEYMYPGNKGENITWNFSGLKSLNVLTGYIEVSSVFETNGEFDNPEIVLKEFENSFYYRYNNNMLEELGIKEGECSKTKYNVPAVKMIYPLRYGSKFQKDFKGTYESPVDIGTIEGTSYIDADGYGKLILPGNLIIDDVLRVKSIKSYDNTYNGQKSHFYITTYRWYAADKRYPLLVLIEITSDTDGAKNTSYKAAYTAEYTKKRNTAPAKYLSSANISLKVFPNPVKEILTISYSTEQQQQVNIDIFDGAGKRVNNVVNMVQEAGFYIEEVNVKSLKLVPGSYIVKIKAGDNELAKMVVIE